MGPLVSQLEYQPLSLPVNHRGNQRVGLQVYLQTNHLVSPQINHLEDQADSLQATRQVRHHVSLLQGQQHNHQANQVPNLRGNLPCSHHHNLLPNHRFHPQERLALNPQLSPLLLLHPHRLANLLLCQVDSQPCNQLRSLLIDLLDSLVGNPVASHLASLRAFPRRSLRVVQARSRVRSHRDNHRHNLLDNHLCSLQVNQLHSRPRIHQLDPQKYRLPSLLYSPQPNPAANQHLTPQRSQVVNLPTIHRVDPQCSPQISLLDNLLVNQLAIQLVNHPVSQLTNRQVNRH